MCFFLLDGCGLVVVALPLDVVLGFALPSESPPSKTAALSSKHSASALRLKHCHSPKPLRFSTAKSATIFATITVDDKLPESTLSYLDSAGDVQTVAISDLTKGKKPSFSPSPSPTPSPRLARRSTSSDLWRSQALTPAPASQSTTPSSWRRGRRTSPRTVCLGLVAQ
ncbi:hypothetical protein TIFTF001_023472 [Ficus carica]|uniref:Uncharacterized protein n=1 Tax=Ficus carica TaxID=3494 RepID=A0AA88B027_FICCA|nr:hypothetical protein TIFTF001_023472 [Ficus carica]